MKKALFILLFVTISSNLFSVDKSIGVKLMYENITTETVYDGSGNIKERKVIKGGESSLNLQIVELVKLKLEKNGFNTDIEGESEYIVDILPSFRIVDVPKEEHSGYHL